MQIHPTVKQILHALANARHEAFIVGGCVRDLLMDRTPKDWDITTDATPEKIQELFPEHFYENNFGTVTIKTGSDDSAVAEIQVTPYREEGKYSDKRHPDSISFAKTLAEDLSRRDFTINAIAMSAGGAITDPHDGQKDMSAKIVRAVGNPTERFNEDALRMMRAVRLATTLEFAIEKDTLSAIVEHANSFGAISSERIRDELIKIIESPRAAQGIQLLEQAGLLQYIIPELREGIGVDQNLHHIYTVWEHNLRTMQYTADQNYSLVVRLSSLLHDVGKPRSKRGEDRHCTFYAHDVIGARMAKKILERLKFPLDIAERVVRLVRYHMFYYNVGEVTESSVRRLLAKVGPEHIDDLLRLREGDRIGSGTPKAVPYKLRHLKYMIEKVSRDPISVKMLKVNGEDIMRILAILPGPIIGLVLNSLLAEVLDNPSLNTLEYLKPRVRELAQKSPVELRESLEKIEKAIEAEEQEHMKKYYV